MNIKKSQSTIPFSTRYSSGWKSLLVREKNYINKLYLEKANLQKSWELAASSTRSCNTFPCNCFKHKKYNNIGREIDNITELIEKLVCGIEKFPEDKVSPPSSFENLQKEFCRLGALINMCTCVKQQEYVCQQDNISEKMKNYVNSMYKKDIQGKVVKNSNVDNSCLRRLKKELASLRKEAKRSLGDKKLILLKKIRVHENAIKDISNRYIR